MFYKHINSTIYTWMDQLNPYNLIHYNKTNQVIVITSPYTLWAEYNQPAFIDSSRCFTAYKQRMRAHLYKER